jgi:microcystin degradation protein MlrC
MRILIGEFAHESNAFCAGTTGFDEFRQWRYEVGPEVVQRHQGTRTVISAFFDGAKHHGFDVIPTVSAAALPSGPVTAEVYGEVKGLMVDGVRESGELDGILLSLHGAMSVEPAAGVVDPEGDLVAALRQALGPDNPIVVVLDLHSDTTELLLHNADLTLAYNEEPHRDAYDRGLEAAARIVQLHQRELHPVRVRERPPLFFPAINMATDHGPMHDLHTMRADLEQTPGVLDISVHGGFYGSDQPEARFSVVCTTDGDLPLATRLARQLATAAWRRRRDFIVELTPIPDAVRQALAAGEPVGLIDECDDPAGGGSADSVAILRGMITGGVARGGISTVKDTEVVQQMVSAGEGATLTVRLGAKSDHLHGESITVTGRVVKLHGAPVPFDTWSGTTYDAGLVGVLDVGGILVVVTEHKLVTENVDIFAPLGFDISTMQAVGCKGLGLHIRQALAGKVRRFIPVDGVGTTHPDVRRLGVFHRLRRPVWPLDDLPDDAYPSSVVTPIGK